MAAPFNEIKFFIASKHPRRNIIFCQHPNAGTGLYPASHISKHKEQGTTLLLR